MIELPTRLKVLSGVFALCLGIALLIAPLLLLIDRQNWLVYASVVWMAIGIYILWMEEQKHKKQKENIFPCGNK